MRRFFLITVFIGLVLIITATFYILKDSTNSPNTYLGAIKLLEDKRTLINLPVYLALEKGYFKANKLDIKLTTSQKGETPMDILAEAKEYEFILCGGEEMVYALQAENQNYKYIYNLAQGSGSYLFSRNYVRDFKAKSLVGKLIIGAPRGTLREMVLEYYLHTNHLAPQRDVNIAQTLTSPDNSSVFQSNSGDFLLIEEPIATTLSNKGLGGIQVNLSPLSSPILAKGLMTTPEIIKTNPHLIKGLAKALYQAQLDINTQPVSEYLPVIKKYFANYTNAELTVAITNYQTSKVWPINPTPQPQQFNNLTKVMTSAGELRKALTANEFLDSTVIKEILSETRK